MTPAEKFTAYARWLRYIHDTHPELPKGIKRATLLAYCQAQARDGAYGIDCFASDARIADELEILHRDVIAGYRRFAIELGWFVPNGKRDRRVEGLNIAIPKDAEKSQVSANIVSNEVQPAAEHDRSTVPGMCAACKPLMEQAYAGKMTKDEVFEIHRAG